MLEKTSIFSGRKQRQKKSKKIHSDFLIQVKVSHIFSDFSKQMYHFEKIKRKRIKVRKICKISNLKYMRKKGDTENLKSSLRIAPKNLKKFVVIHHEKVYLYAYFHIFLSSRALKRKNVLIIDFPPCYLNGKLRPFWGVQIDRNGPSHHMEYFLLFFLETFYMVTLMKKSIWEIRNAQYHCTAFWYF